MPRDKIVVGCHAGEASVGGVPLFQGDMSQALSRIDELNKLPGNHFVITPNVNMLIAMGECDALWDTLREARLVLTDGQPIVLLARALGAERLTRLTGADLLPASLSRSEETGWRIALVGGSTASRELAVRGFRGRYPEARIEGFALPTLAGPDDPASAGTIAELHAWRPNLIFIGLDSPKRELWWRHWRGCLPDGVYIGSGAASDFAAGTAPRAPEALQRLALEWAWRLAHEPRRLAHRYLVRGPRFLGIAARSLASSVRESRRAQPRRTRCAPVPSAPTNRRVAN
jgi:N-acetylglucosaminyldiphosphoundecaprenol N-acetyl-beta-D-mannosaminyltransferase